MYLQCIYVLFYCGENENGINLINQMYYLFLKSVYDFLEMFFFLMMKEGHVIMHTIKMMLKSYYSLNNILCFFYGQNSQIKIFGLIQTV